MPNVLETARIMKQARRLEQRSLGEFAADCLLSQPMVLRRFALDILQAEDVHPYHHHKAMYYFDLETEN